MRASDACRSIRRSFDFSRAKRAQEALRGKVVLKALAEEPRHVMGLDVAYWRPQGQVTYGVGVAALINARDGSAEECWAFSSPVCVPYVPGFLAFREMALLALPALKAIRSSSGEPLVIFVDGHGLAHPRGYGIASHVGVALSRPSLGVAKRPLYGSLASCRLGTCIEVDGRVVGLVITNPQGRRLYVSVGTGMTVEDAYRLVTKYLLPGAALPLPTQAADLVSKELRRLISAGKMPIGLINCRGELHKIISSLRSYS